MTRARSGATACGRMSVVGIQMLDVSVLPAGARRDLAEAIYGLYEHAGRPATRELAEAIRTDDSLPGTLSHEGVAAMIRGSSRYAKWANLESLVRTLASRDLARPDLESVISRIRDLWMRAAREASSGSDTKDPAGTATAGAASAWDSLSVIDYLVFEGRAKTSTFASTTADLGPVPALLSRTSIEAVIAECEAVGDDVAAEIIEYGAGLPFSQIIAECGSEQEIDGADISMITAAVYRPASEIAEAMLRTYPQRKDLLVAFTIVELFMQARPLTELMKLYIELWTNGDARRVEGVFRRCGAVRDLSDLAELLGMLRQWGADNAVQAIRLGMSRRPPRDIVHLTELLCAHGQADDASEVLSSAALRGSPDDVVALLAALRDAEQSVDAEYLISSIAYRNAKDLVEVIAALRRSAHDASAEQILRSVAIGKSQKIAEVLIELHRLNRHGDTTFLLTEVRTQRVEPAATLRVILELAGLKEHARLLTAAPEPIPTAGPQSSSGFAT